MVALSTRTNLPSLIEHIIQHVQGFLFVTQRVSLGECGLRCIMTACNGFNFNKLGEETGECYLDQSRPDINHDTDQYFTKFMFGEN